MKHVRLQKTAYSEIVELALKEDIGSGDITSSFCIDHTHKSSAKLIAKEDMTLCGVEVAAYIFALLDPTCKIKCMHTDGDKLLAGDIIMQVSGSSQGLLQAERTALNFLQRLSGISTLVAKYADAIKDYDCKVVDTRKTTPGLRALEKYAVRIGGGHNHRAGLFDGVLIKENHIKAAGSIKKAVKACTQNVSHLIKVEVEVENLKEFSEALASSAQVIMLDNFSLEDIREAVKQNKGKAILETSGNVNLQNIAELAKTKVDIISVGRLTHSAKAVDISMLFE